MPLEKHATTLPLLAFCALALPVQAEPAHPTGNDDNRDALTQVGGQEAVASTSESTGANGRPTTTSSEEAALKAEKVQAGALYRQGVAEFKAERYRAAVAMFLQADSIHPSPAFSYNIARAYDGMGDKARSLQWYRDYLRRAPQATDKDQVLQRIAERQRELQAQGVQQVTVYSTPPGAALRVDGDAVGVTPWTGEFPPGSHHVRLSSPEHQDIEANINLDPGRALDVELTLSPLPVVVEPPQPRPRASAPAHHQPPPMAPGDQETAYAQPSWPWWVLGVGAGALAVAGGFELARRGAEDDASNARTQIERASHFDRMMDYQDRAQLFAALGGGSLLVAGVGWYFAQRAAEDTGVAIACSQAGCAVFTEQSF